VAWSGPADWAGLANPDEPPHGRLAAALTLLASVVRRLEVTLAAGDDPEVLARAFLAAEFGTLEYDLAVALEHLRASEDPALVPVTRLLQERLSTRVRATLAGADSRLAATIGNDLAAHNEHPRSVARLIHDEYFDRGRQGRHPRVWLVIFDGMRWDTWVRVLRPALAESFEALARPEDELRFALLPSLTQVSRTALLAGAPPRQWLTPQGGRTTDEQQLGLLGFHLPPGERERWRLVKRGDEQPGDWLDASDVRPYNALIYNVSDDRIHHFALDVAALNREIRNSLRDRIVRDLRTIVGEGDLLLVTSDHGFVELDPAAALEVTAPGGATVNYRYVAGARLPELPSIELEMLGPYTVAVGGAWFRRPGGHATRYAHGGLSFAELLVPGGAFTRSAMERLSLHWGRAPALVEGREGEEAKVTLTLVNAGNRPTRYRLQVSSAIARLPRVEGELSVGGEEQVTVTVEAPPGRHEIGVGGTYGGGAALDRSLGQAQITIEIAERTDRVEFDRGAFDLIDRLFDD
jgi:hypothetical protein